MKQSVNLRLGKVVKIADALSIQTQKGQKPKKKKTPRNYRSLVASFVYEVSCMPARVPG